MLSDGASLLTDGAEDVNDAGLVDNGTSPAAPFAFNGSFSSTGGGRFQVSLTNYVGGTTFAAYPSVGGLLMLQVDSLGGGITAGIALPQQPDATIALRKATV